MKTFTALMTLLLAVAGLCASQIAGIPVSEIQSAFRADNLNGSMRLMADQGYGILHYDDQFAIAVTPAVPYQGLERAQFLSAFPTRENLYLVGKLPQSDNNMPREAGRVLLDLGASLLLESGMSDVELRGLIRNPFTLLSLEPIRFPEIVPAPNLSEAARTDINAILSLVNVNAVQTRIQALQDFQTRYARASNRLQVAEWIRQQFLAFGVTDAQLQTFTWDNTQQYNVVATIPGTVYPDQYIIVGGHHDSVSSNSDPYTFAPGADDNASGAVAALEMARVMMASGYQPRTSIRFVTFAAEEFGLWGSKHYAQDALVSNQNIRLMMNHDMIANNNAQPSNWQVRLMPYDGSMNHSAYASQITEQFTTLTTFYGNMNSGSSDSYPFWQRGYNVIYFFEADFSSVYHSDQDIVANLDPAYCTEVIKASVACAVTFAEMPAAPFNLQTHDCGNGTSIQLTWEGYNDPSIAYYNVYYGTSMANWGDPQTTTGTSITISGLNQGQLYYFGVSAVDTFSNESYLIYATGVPLSVPLEPQNFADQPVFQGIELNWDPNGELDLAGYKLYRSQTDGVLGDQIGGTITAPGYLDTDVTGSANYYYYSLCAVDTDDNASPFAQVVRSRPITLDQGILIVDETENLGGTNPLQPNDVQVDDFYNEITQHFDSSMLDLNELPGNLKLADIGVYSSILWHGNDFANMDPPYVVRDVLQSYIEAGGNVFFTLYMPSMAFELNAGYPMAFAPQTYIYSVIGIAEADYQSSARFRYADPVHDQFPLVQIDPLKTSPSLNGHIIRVESIGPNPDCATVYNYGSDYLDSEPMGAMNNMPIGVLNLNNNGKVLTVSFPLYNLYEDQARALVDYVFTEYFNESFSSADDPSAWNITPISVSANHPNPFSGKTSFRVELKNNALPLEVGIYNLRGQLVKTVFSGNSPKSRVLEWDGLDNGGSSVASGIYYIRATQGGKSVQQRIALIR
ncbi:MAG: M20/M25/M40 family metallo-hydrolase [Candidatus Syntrophosphaera sp.]|nr:M20/M25/M40 family metallo-hydrolase [Candidatus Syntrophosphaera sp.]